MHSVQTIEILEVVRRNGPYDYIVRQAREAIDPLPLPEALELVFDTGETDLLLQDAMAVRWLTRAADELVLTIHEVSWVASRLNELRVVKARPKGSLEKFVLDRTRTA